MPHAIAAAVIGALLSVSAAAASPAQIAVDQARKAGQTALADIQPPDLDAFYQKTLVYQQTDGKAVAAFSDIAAMAECDYERSIKPHSMLNDRQHGTPIGRPDFETRARSAFIQPFETGTHPTDQTHCTPPCA